MIDIHAHVEGLVRDQLTKACRATGIDDSVAGYAVGGHGQLMAMANGESIGFAAGWLVTVSLRSRLLGQPPVAASVPVPGVMPSDDDFRAVVDKLVEVADQQRRAEVFSRKPVPEM